MFKHTHMSAGKRILVAEYSKTPEYQQISGLTVMFWEEKPIKWLGAV